MQPTAQAVGEKWNQSKPQRGEREATTQSPEGRPSSHVRSLAPEGRAFRAARVFLKPAREFDMAETYIMRRKWRAGLRIAVVTLLAIVFPLLFSERPAARRRPAGRGMSRLPRRQDHDYHASRQNGFAVRGRQEIRGFHPRQLGVHGLPRRPGRKRLSARNAGAGKVWNVPLGRAGAICPLAAREGECARRRTRAPMRELPRQPRHRSGEGSRDRRWRR